MIAFRYALRNVPMKIADKSFTAEGVEFPAGSFVIAPPADMTAARAAVEQFGLTAASLTAAAGGGDARRRPAADCDVLVVDRHAGDRLGALHVRQVRDPVRPDLQGARQEGQPAQRLRRHPHADAAGQPSGGLSGARRPARAVHEGRRSTSSSGCTASPPTSPAAWAAKAWTRSRSSSTAAARSSPWGMPSASRPSSALRAPSTRQATRRATSTRRVRSSTPRCSSSITRCSTATRRRSCRSSTWAGR